MENSIIPFADMSIEELDKVVMTDAQKALYWHNRKFGSEAQQADAISHLMHEAIAQGKTGAISPYGRFDTKEGRIVITYEQRNVTTKGMCNHQEYIVFMEHVDSGTNYLFSIRTGESSGMEDMDTHVIINEYAMDGWAEACGITEKDPIERFRTLTMRNFASGIDYNDKEIEGQRSCRFTFPDGVMYGFMKESVQLKKRVAHLMCYVRPDDLQKDDRETYDSDMQRIREYFYPDDEQCRRVAEQTDENYLVFRNGFCVDNKGREMVPPVIEVSCYAALYRLYNDLYGEYPTKAHTPDDAFGLLKCFGLLVEDKTATDDKVLLDHAAKCLVSVSIIGCTSNPFKSRAEVKVHVERHLRKFLDNPDAVLRFKREINSIQQQYQTNIMEQKMHTELAALLKRHGLAKKFEREVEKIASLRKAQYLEWVEGIYAISRIIPTVSDDKLRDKLTEANREWVAIIIDKDLCQQLRPYYERHGKELVKKAILYLIDKNVWTSPVSDKALKAKQPTNYDGLKDIDETVQFLKDEEYISNENVHENENDNSTTRNNESPEEPRSPEASNGITFDIEAMKATRELVEGRHAYHIAVEAMRDAVEKMEVLGKVCLNDELLTMLEDDNKRLEAENKQLRDKVAQHDDLRQRIDAKYDEAMDRQEEEYKKQIATLQDRNTVLAKELDREKKLHREDNERNYQNTLAKEKAEKDLAALRQQHSQTVADLDTLRRAAKEAQETPAVRFIAMEELDSLPLMGNKMKSVLIPLLEKHSVKVMTEAEIRKARKK